MPQRHQVMSIQGRIGDILAFLAGPFNVVAVNAQDDLLLKKITC